MFQDRYEYADRGYDDYDSEDGRWDYTAGLEQLERWFAEMLEMAADGEWVDASVGLLLTLQKLRFGMGRLPMRIKVRSFRN